MSNRPTKEDYERAIARAEAVFAKNKSRMWVLKMVREYIAAADPEPTPAEKFSIWLSEGPRLAKEAGLYVGIKVSAASDSQPSKATS